MPNTLPNCPHADVRHLPAGNLYSGSESIITTINSEDQGYAYKALRSHLQSYDHSQGYRGPEAKVDISDPKTREQNISNALQEALIATDMPGGRRLRSLADGS